MDWNERIENKIDKVLGEISAIKENHAAHNATDSEYYKRTDYLEKEMAPLKRHKNMMEGAAKVLALIGIVAGIAEALILWLKK